MTLTRYLSIGSALVLVVGCRTLPDVQKFTDATVGLRSAVAESGATIVGELRQTPLDGVKEQAAKLEAAWVARNAAMSALVEYGNSLQAIVDSGKKGEESVRKLADAANKLAGTLGAANLLAGTTGSLVTDTLAFVYGQIAQARAAKSLEEALREMQPAVDRVAQLLAADLKNSDDILRVAAKAQLDALEEANQREIAYHEELLTTRGLLMSSITAQLQASPPKKPTELTDTAELARINEMLAKTETWAADFQQKRTAITARTRAARELIGATAQALPDWSAAHAKLLAAVTARHTPSLTELTEATQRIRELVDRYRKL